MKTLIPNSFVKLDSLINERIDEIFNTKSFVVKNYVCLNKKDSDLILESRNCNDVVKQMVNNKRISEIEHHKFILNLKSHNDKDLFSKKRYYWAIFKNHKFLGSMYLTNMDLKNSFCTCGTFLNPKTLGSGFGMLIIYIQHFIAFEMFNISKMESLVEINNKKALRINKFFGAEILKNKKIGEREFYPILFKKKTWKNKIKNYHNLINKII